MPLLSDNTLERQHKLEIQKLILNIQKKLDEKLYGMNESKEQVLLFLHDRLMNPFSKKQNVLCLQGEPGVGKTSMCLALSQVLGLPFEQISLGGKSSSEFLLGHDYTYIGSRCGAICKSLIKMNSSNGIILLDEIDKACQASNEIVNSFLHILDPSQNSSFRDNFFGSELTIDLSRIFFICSVNQKIEDRALSDRLFYVEVKDYTDKEKCTIIKNYLLPQILNEYGTALSDIKITISDENIMYFIQRVSPNRSGIRKIKSCLSQLISKVLFLENNPDINVSFSLKKVSTRKQQHSSHSKKDTLLVEISKDMIHNLLKNEITKPLNQV